MVTDTNGTFADVIVGAMSPDRLTQCMSLLCGMLNKELKLEGSVQAFSWLIIYNMMIICLGLQF